MPAFAAFQRNSDADQRRWERGTDSGKKDTCYHGNAGIASAFAALAHKKIKPGGVLALVLPLSIASGLSWQGFREMLDDDYTDVTVLSIAANGRDMSFSSDTGMAECLVIARKLKKDESPKDRARFTSLRHRPQGFAHASSLAGRLLDGSHVRGLEDGPYGGTPTDGRRGVGRRDHNHPSRRGREELGRSAPVRPFPGPDRLRSVPI